LERGLGHGHAGTFAGSQIVLVERRDIAGCPRVVEGRNALLDGTEIGRALRRHEGDEVSDGFLRRAIAPGRKRVGLRLRHASHRKSKPEATDATSSMRRAILKFILPLMRLDLTRRQD
jgi:hypothetical protein